MRIQIYITEENPATELFRDLNIPVDENPMTTFMYFRNQDLEGIWIAPSGVPGPRFMVVYAMGDSFKCPYDKDIANTIIEIIEDQDLQFNNQILRTNA